MRRGRPGPGVALAAVVLVLACRSALPPDPFAVGRLPDTDRAPVRLTALYAVPPADALVAAAVREDAGALAGGSSAAALLEIAWEDAVTDAVESSFVRARRVPSLSDVAPAAPGDVLVAIALEDVDAGGGGGAPARVRIAWSVTSRAGGLLWSDSIAGEAPADGARGLLAALRHAAVEARRSLLGQTLWRRYEPSGGAPSARRECG